MRLTFWLSIGLLALVLSACGPTPLPLANAERDAAFEITVYQGQDVLGGQSVRFSEVFAQGKPVVLNMWAGLCPICRTEMPELQEAYEKYGDRVLIIGVDIGPFVSRRKST